MQTPSNGGAAGARRRERDDDATDERPPKGARGATGQDADIGKTERILNLVSCLLKERRPVPWREIAGRVVGYDDGSDIRSLERRFERDKAALKEMGVRIIYCPPGQYETEGYLIPREACFIDKLELLPHESALLDLLSELALRKGGAGFSADLMSALQKLRFDASVRARPAPRSADGALAGKGGAPALGHRIAGAKPIVFPPPESEVEDGVHARRAIAAAAAHASAPADGAAPEKKKRGRPRKALPAPEATADDAAKAAAPGRPAVDRSSPVKAVPRAAQGPVGARDEPDDADDEIEVGEAERREPGPPTPLESSLLDLDLAGALRADPNVELLTQALLANRAVAFTYFSVHSDERRRREIDPYGIGFSRGAWYVVGWDHLRKEIRQFRLDRIEGAVEAIGPERAFKAPKGFAVTEYLEKPTWEMASRPPVEVEIEVAPGLAFFVEDLIAGKGEVSPGSEPGSARVKLDVRDRTAFVRWALAHLRHVRVLRPAEVREALREEIDALRKMHAGSSSHV